MAIANGNGIVDFISDLTPMIAKSDWRVQVRILNVWTPTYGNYFDAASIEALLIDEEGHKIQASVPKKLIWKFQSLMEEGATKIISNFDLAQSRGNYRSNKYAYKIIFMRNTNVENSEIQTIPRYSFNFIPFNDILTTPISNEYLIDLIGEIVGVGVIEEGPDRKILNIELKDLE